MRLAIAAVSLCGLFSENVSQALFLVGWWLLLEWKDTSRDRWLIALAVCTAWMAIETGSIIAAVRSTSA